MRWGLVAGCAAALGAVALLVRFDNVGSAASSPPLPPKDPPRGGSWVKIEGDAVDLAPGVRYRACLRMSFVNPARALLTVDRITAGLQDAGFGDVRVASGSTPPNWGSTDEDCYRYVDATWTRPAKRMDRPGVVDLAWRWVPA